MPHIHDAIDYGVIAYLVHDDRVLLIFHHALQHWFPLGGHIELDEDPEQALIREVTEESGIQPQYLQTAATKSAEQFPGYKFLLPPTFLDIHDISPTHRHIGLIYVLKSTTDEVVLAQGEHEQIKWFTQEELAQSNYDLMTGTQYYATEALKIGRDPTTHWEPLQ